jgi:hypothetical protein
MFEDDVNVVVPPTANPTSDEFSARFQCKKVVPRNEPGHNLSLLLTLGQVVVGRL